MATSRQLAAIMFTDIVGYTSLMGRDEKRAVTLLEKNLELHSRCIKRYKGKLLKEMGDGILVSFPTVSNAVYCAGLIQNESVGIEGLNLRIGIHLGEVIVKGRDIFGDGVNIASRIEGLAVSGQILVSESVYKNIRNRQGIKTEFLGEKMLKNVAEPVKIYSVRVDEIPDEYFVSESVQRKKGNRITRTILFGAIIILVMAIAYLVGSDFPSGSKSSDVEKSIAVLPFRNMSSNQENQFFCDGMMEAILNHLSKIKDLRVISRTSVEQYRNDPPAIKDIGQQLDVNYIVEGSVLRIEEDAQITVQLIEASTDSHLWSEQYSTDMADIFGVLAEITETISAKLEATLLPEVKERIEAKPTESNEAFNHYLKGRESYNSFKINLDINEIENAIQSYRTSIEIDNNFSLGYVSLAQAIWEKDFKARFYEEVIVDSVITLCNKAISIDPNVDEAYFVRSWGYRERSEFILQGKDLSKTIQLNPNHAGAHLELARYSVYIEGDYLEGLDLLKKAEKLARGELLSEIYEAISWTFLDLGLFEDAEVYAKEAQDINPNVRSLFWIYTHHGAFNEALNEASRLYAIFPQSEPSLWYMAVIHLYLENFTESEHFFRKLIEKMNEKGEGHEFMRYRHRFAYILWKLGRTKEAIVEFNESINHLEKGEQLGRFIGRDNVAYNLASIYSFLENKPKAYLALNILNEYGWHWGYPFHIERDPMFDKLRQETKFRNIVRNVQEEKRQIREEITRLKATGVLDL